VTGQLFAWSTSRILRLAGAGAGRQRAEVKRVASVKMAEGGIIVSVGKSLYSL